MEPVVHALLFLHCLWQQTSVQQLLHEYNSVGGDATKITVSSKWQFKLERRVPFHHSEPRLQNVILFLLSLPLQMYISNWCLMDERSTTGWFFFFKKSSGSLARHATWLILHLQRHADMAVVRRSDPGVRSDHAPNMASKLGHAANMGLAIGRPCMKLSTSLLLPQL